MQTAEMGCPNYTYARGAKHAWEVDARRKIVRSLRFKGLGSG